MSSSAVGPLYFYEDEVYRINKNGEMEFGMVTENWEMYSSSEDEDDFSEPDKVPHGHVAITWHPKGKDEVIPEAKVKLSDRSLMPGDVVRRLIAGKDTQRGYCRSVRVLADVQLVGSKKVIQKVPATSLLPVQKLQSEVAVYLDSWIGVIVDVKYLVKLKFTENSSCTIASDLLLDRFEDLRRTCEGFGASEVFYPGQKLRGAMKHLKEADWTYSSDDLKRAKDRKIVTAVVTDVNPISLRVQWQWQTPDVNNQDQTPFGEKQVPPSDTILGEDLKRIKLLNLFESCTVQLGDVSYYTPCAKDVMSERGEWKKKLKNIAVLFHANPANVDLAKSTSESLVPLLSAEEGGDDGDMDVVESNEELAVGSESNNNKDLPKENPLVKNSSSDIKKILPKVCTRKLRKKKLKKAARQPSVPVIPEMTQTVVETLHTQSVVDIVWQDGTYEEGMESTELYPIHHLDDHEFFPGDFVVLADSNDFRKYGVIQKMDHCGRVAWVKWFEAYSCTGEQKPTESDENEMSVYDIKDHPDFRFRPGTIVIRVANMQNDQSPAGQILDNYPDGQVRVWWANGVITPCWPQDLFRLGDYDSDEGEMWDDGGRQSDSEGEEEDDANSDDSWETETEEECNDVDASQRYQTIGRLIEHIQKTLVCTREAIVASSNVSVSGDIATGAASPVAKLGGFDERELTKKLLLIYKDCQYLDKIMGTKFFDVEDLKNWYKDNESASIKSRRIIEQISRFFDVPKTSASAGDLLSESETNIVCITKEDATSDEVFSTPTKNPPTRRDSNEEFNTGTPGMLLFELCSVILRKLVEAHSEYEKRFGGFKSEHLSSTRLLNDAKKGIEALAECLGGKPLAAIKEMNSLDAEEPPSAVESTCDLPVPADVDEPMKDSDVLPQESEALSQTPSQETLLPVHSSSSNFNMISCVPDTHRYRLTLFQPQNQRLFLKTVQKETSLLRESLPDGIYVKSFEDRMDLYSALIKGPEKTPYEDGMFLFDIHLPPAYPSVPPMVHYIAFCTDRLNPNLYEEGKVCVSLLGTWSGKGTEVWTSSSSLLQLLVSIQGLILGHEPYYNEAGYDKQRGTQQGAENSRMYNENVLIKLVQSMSRMFTTPPSPWEKETAQHLKDHGPKLIERYSKWLALSDHQIKERSGSDDLPGFPLLPASKGFSITLKKTLVSYEKLLATL